MLIRMLLEIAAIRITLSTCLLLPDLMMIFDFAVLFEGRRGMMYALI